MNARRIPVLKFVLKVSDSCDINIFFQRFNKDFKLFGFSKVQSLSKHSHSVQIISLFNMASESSAHVILWIHILKKQCNSNIWILSEQFSMNLDRKYLGLYTSR